MSLQHNQLTRKIFHKIHLKQIEQKIGFKKVKSLLNLETLKIKKNYFKGKICADFGCGSTGAGAYSLLKKKAKFVHLLDLNKHIIKPIKKNLKEYEGKYQIDIGSIEKTKYKNNYFDFILCRGVIHHAFNDLKCIKEIHRTLKKNGQCELMVLGEGGIITNSLLKIIRPEFKKNLFIKNFLNKIMFNKIQGYKTFFNKNLDKEGRKTLTFLSKYVDQDLLLTMRDLILAPKYKTYNEKKLRKLLSKTGFKNIYRVRPKVKYKNIRQLLSPLYYNYDHEISRALYGEGCISLIMKKK